MPPDYDPKLERYCPNCGASPGDPCLDDRGNVVSPHRER